MSPDLIVAIIAGVFIGAVVRILMFLKKKRVREAVAAEQARAAKEAQAARATANPAGSSTRKRRRRR